MGRSSKPRKAYVPGKVIRGGHLPLPVAKSEGYELKALMYLQALAGGFCTSPMATEAALFVASCAKLHDLSPGMCDLVLSASRAMSSIHDRHTRTGKWGASGDELQCLEKTLPKLVARFNSFSRGKVSDATLEAQMLFTRKLLSRVK